MLSDRLVAKRDGSDMLSPDIFDNEHASVERCPLLGMSDRGHWAHEFSVF